MANVKITVPMFRGINIFDQEVVGQLLVVGDEWQIVVTLYASGSGYLIIPILYHTFTEPNKINFGCTDYYVDLIHYNTEEEIADVIAQCEEKINQVIFKVKEYELKIKEQKMKKDF